MIIIIGINVIIVFILVLVSFLLYGFSMSLSLIFSVSVVYWISECMNSYRKVHQASEDLKVQDQYYMSSRDQLGWVGAKAWQIDRYKLWYSEKLRTMKGLALLHMRSFRTKL